MTKGYKGTFNYKCLDQLYEIGREYKIDEKPAICQKGFHYCRIARHVLNHYNFTSTFKLLEIDDLSKDTVHKNDKSCSNHIKIIREITNPNELIQLLGYARTYDAEGKIVKCQDLSGYYWEQTYDEQGRVKTYKNSSGYSTTYEYKSVKTGFPLVDVYFSDSHTKPESIFHSCWFDKKYERISIDKFGSSNVGYKGAPK